MCEHHGSLPSAPLSRRTALSAAGAGLLIAGLTSRHTPAIADTGSVPAVGAARASRITAGTTLVHADLHNHTLLSDGDGDPALAFDSMRSAGLDVAALTDHATYSDNALGDVLTDALPPDYHQAAGLTPNGWARTREYADAANTDGAFTAIRGFEWSEPLLGHVNVWFTEHYVDVLQAGLMAPLLEWLRREPGLVLDGGADGIAGFNHPGREPGRFEEFRFDPRPRDQMVSLEMFNRRDDYLFEGWADGQLLTAVRLSQRRLADRDHRRHRRARRRLGPPGGQGPDRALGRRPHPGRGQGRDAGEAVLRHPHVGAAGRRHRRRSAGGPAVPMGSVLPVEQR